MWLDHGTTKSGDGRGIPLNADALAALESVQGKHPRWCFTFAGHRGPELMELGGWKSYEMVLRYADLAPEKLGAVASRIERQPLVGLTEELRGRNVSSVATFPLRSIN